VVNLAVTAGLVAVVSFLLSAGSGVARAAGAGARAHRGLGAMPWWGSVRRTGKRLLEKHMARSKGAAYTEYVRRTSGFIPRPLR
jgi:steroid 5-alpha reductase family enzyme